MNPQEMLSKWIAWIDIIHKNVEDLLISQHIYKKYIEIVKKNPTIQSPSDFHDWVRRNYASSVAIHIRRELDNTHSDVVSLKRLLVQIQKNPQSITISWYRTLYKDDPWGFADVDFQKVAGNGGYFDPQIAEQDIKKLEKLGEHIEEYATLRIAHNSKKPVTKDPTYNDLEVFVKTYENIVKKYILLFTALGYTSLTPTWQYDWEEIFTKPWIK